MEDQHFYKLYYYFSRPINIYFKDGITRVNKIPTPEFNEYSDALVSQFIGEVKRNFDQYNDVVISELVHYKFKFSLFFKREFRVDFNDRDKQLNYDIFSVNESSYPEELKSVIKIKWDTYHYALSFIDHELEEFKKIGCLKVNKYRQPRRKPDKQDLYFDISNALLHEICTYLIKRNYISGNTDHNDFINVFTGRNFNNPIHWHKNNFQLAYLIKEINKLFGKKYHDGIWDLVVFRFVKKDGSKFDINALKKASKSKNENLDYINYIVTLIQEELGN